jgi:hypothetical protein
VLGAGEDHATLKKYATIIMKIVKFMSRRQNAYTLISFRSNVVL